MFSTLMSLVLALVVMGVGLATALGLGKMLWDGWRARGWVLVQASVTEAELIERRKRRSTIYRAEGVYRYRFAGEEYEGRRLGLTARGSGDWLGGWHAEMATFLARARDEQGTVAVYVNPGNPRQAVVDRQVRWGLVASKTLETIFLAVFGVLIWNRALQPDGLRTTQ
jgi:hypothetical protein